MAEEGDRIAMSQRERDRWRVLQDVKEGRYTQAKAAELLKLSVRQVRRLQERCYLVNLLSGLFAPCR